MSCPCGLPQSFDDCCGRFIDGRARPETPEQLMRSRYSAYARREIDYLVATHDPPPDRAAIAAWAEAVTFTGLTVLDAKGDQVEFEARYTEPNGAPAVLRERSRFARRSGGAWAYVGTVQPPSKNGPCPCGSGKKYKRCCGA